MAKSNPRERLTLLYAHLGALSRLKEAAEEVEGILEAFPVLRDHPENPFHSTAPRGRKVAATEESPRARKRKRPAMSAAQKAEVSARMKKYWAERRKTKGVAKRAKKG